MLDYVTQRTVVVEIFECVQEHILALGTLQRVVCVQKRW